MSMKQSAGQITPSERPAGGWTESVVSIAVAVHCMIVFICASSNYRPSALQQQILTLLRPYVQPLGIDWNYTPFYLTHGPQSDRWCVAEYKSTEDEQWRPLHAAWSWNSESLLRWQRWMRFWAYYADAEEDQLCAEIVKALAQYVKWHGGHVPARVRLRRIPIPDWETAMQGDTTAWQSTPTDSGVHTIYEAVIFQDDYGQLFVARVSNLTRAAPPMRRSPP